MAGALKKYVERMSRGQKTGRRPRDSALILPDAIPDFKTLSRRHEVANFSSRTGISLSTKSALFSHRLIVRSLLYACVVP